MITSRLLRPDRRLATLMSV